MGVDECTAKKIYVKGCIREIVEEKEAINMSTQEIYSYFIRPIHYLQAAKDVLSTPPNIDPLLPQSLLEDEIAKHLSFVQKTAIEFYDNAYKKIGLIDQEPHQNLHNIIHYLSLYAEILLKRGKCNKKQPEIDKKHIVGLYDKMLGIREIGIIDFYFGEHITQLKKDICKQ